MSLTRLLLLGTLVLSVIAGLAALYHSIHQDGYDQAEQKAIQEIAVAREEGLRRSLALTVENTKVSYAYRKAREDHRSSESLLDNTASLLADELVAAKRLHNDSLTRAGADDPRDSVVTECTREVATLGKENIRLADKVTGLQGYAGKVCLAATPSSSSQPTEIRSLSVETVQ